jgi:hypothetical protein
MNKNIIFFVKSFNDFDNILPVISFIKKNKLFNKIQIFSLVEDMSDFKIHTDFCKNSLNISVIYLFNEYNSKIYKLLFFFIRHSAQFSKRKNGALFVPLILFNSRIKYVIQLLSNFIISRHGIYENCNSIFMIDFGNELSPFGHSIVRSANNNKIPVIGYLHGYNIYTNTDTLTLDKSKIGFIKKMIIRLSKHNKERLYCDCYLTGVNQKNTMFRSSQMSNFSEKELYRIKEVGIPRYSKQWCEIYKNNVIKERGFHYGDTKKINVSLFLSHSKYNVDLSILYDMIYKLSLLDNINFVIKPHTRNKFNGLKKDRLIAYDASNVSSLSISQWSDVGIVFGSSIGIQLLADKKVLIVPSFIDTNNTIFQEMNVCVDVKSIDDIVMLLRLTDKKNIYKLINNKNVGLFFNKIVYGGRSYNDQMNSFYKETIDCKSCNA